MAHDVESMAYVGKTPWHGLGTQVPDNLTPWEMLEIAGLDWKVEKRPLIISGEDKQLASHYALLRSNDKAVLGISGSEYIPLQNETAFEFFDKFIKAGSMKMDTAGSLRGGKWVWALAKINDHFLLPGDDEVSAYLLLANPHVWGKSMTIKFTAIRTVCMNTLTMGLNDNLNKFRFPHIRDFDAVAMRSAEEALGLAKFKMKDFKDMATLLSKKDFTESELIQYATELFGRSNLNGDVVSIGRNGAEFLQYVETQPGANLLSSKGKWWGALNAVTFMIDHKMGISNDVRVESAWFGQKEVLKKKALQLALDYAK